MKSCISIDAAHEFLERKTLFLSRMRSIAPPRRAKSSEWESKRYSLSDQLHKAYKTLRFRRFDLLLASLGVPSAERLIRTAPLSNFHYLLCQKFFSHVKEIEATLGKHKVTKDFSLIESDQRRFFEGLRSLKLKVGCGICRKASKCLKTLISLRMVAERESQKERSVASLPKKGQFLSKNSQKTSGLTPLTCR